MPKRATTRPTTRRSAPYQLRSINGTSQCNNMAVAVAPMVGWDPIPHQHHGYLSAQQQQQYDHYQQQVMLQDYSTIPTPLSAAPAVQHVHSPILPASHSHSHSHSNSSNTGGGPWTAEMDEILIDNHKRMKWDQIAERFFNNTKTGNACRKRYARVISERKEPSKWAPERVQRVIDAYKRGSMRERMWRPLAEELGENWEHVEKLCLNQGLKAMTREIPYAYGRRQSRAASHRSHPSINSDSGRNDGYEDDDPTDDSGLGGEIHGNHLLQVQPQAYISHSGPYHDGITTDYETDSYHYR